LKQSIDVPIVHYVNVRKTSAVEAVETTLEEPETRLHRVRKTSAVEAVETSFFFW